mgnify:CR=1 FL=1
MSKNTIQSIFEEKSKLDDTYPHSPGTTTFDLERKHLLYGKIDDEGDVVIADTNSLVGVESPGRSSNLLIDFVADAFFSLRANFAKAARAGLNRDSIYYKDLKVYKSWTHGSLDTRYLEYISTIYETFVNDYLASNRRHEKIKNFKDFTREFLRYSLRVCRNYPITMSGYIASVHCSPFVSGLMLETAPEQHGVENNINIYRYIGDENYDFWRKEVQKFGFMIDKNAPWRLVFNVASGFNQYKEGPDNPVGAHKFMARYGVTYENVFQYRFLKAYMYDLTNLKNTMNLLYKGFYQQFSTYEKEEIRPCITSGQSIQVIHERKDRVPPPSELEIQGSEQDEYWLKVLLKLKMTETAVEHNAFSFNSHADDLIEVYRLFGHESALARINSLTKGFRVTKFNMKGGYWSGVPEMEYERRRQQAIENAEDPGRVQYSLTGTGNTVK